MRQRGNLGSLSLSFDKGLMEHVVAVETFIWTVQQPPFLHATYAAYTPDKPPSLLHKWVLHASMICKEAADTKWRVFGGHSKHTGYNPFPAWVEHPQHILVTGEEWGKATIHQNMQSYWCREAYNTLPTSLHRQRNWLNFMLWECCQVFNIARWIVTYTFEWFLNYI